MDQYLRAPLSGPVLARPFFVPKAGLGKKGTQGSSRSYATVYVLQADDVVLVELAEGDLEYPDLTLAHRREPVYRLPGDEELLFYLGMEDLPVQLDSGAGIQDHPELVALVVVLAREHAARGDRDDLDRAGQVVGVLLEPAPGLLYFYRMRPMIQAQPPEIQTRRKFRLSAPTCGEGPPVANSYDIADICGRRGRFPSSRSRMRGLLTFPRASGWCWRSRRMRG